jgi:hypothetical protein
MKKKRLVTAIDVAQLYQTVPLKFDNEDWKEYNYTSYGNIAWVSPSEAEKIADAFGKQYVLEGSKEGTFYVNPKYLEPEVEALIWRSRGTTPIEGNDKTTYASNEKVIMAGKCPTCKGMKSTFNKELNKREKCKDCLGTGEMSGAKREKIQKEKKEATFQLNTVRLIKSSEG